jgi:hypothetical protein
MTNTTPKEEKLDDVVVTTGALSGMSFRVEDHTPVTDGRVKVKYAAPHNGPRVVIEHVQVRGEFVMQERTNAVRSAFSRLIPANIQHDSEKGYSERTSGKSLVWDQQRARFVLSEEKEIKNEE